MTADNGVAGRRHRLSETEKAFRLGVITSVGFLVHGHGMDSVARELLETNNLTLAKAVSVDATEYDLSAIRKALRR